MEKWQQQGISREKLSSYEEQCHALARDWKQLGDLIEQYRAPDADRHQLEDSFLTLRSALSCDYPILTYWRKGGFGLTAGINRMIAGSPTLGGLAETPEATRTNWQAVWSALQKVNGALAAARQSLDQGKEAHLPGELLQHDTHVPFPIKKILKVLGAAAAVLLVLATVYVMRNFLGFWAPGAGEGIVVTDGMTNEEQIESVLMLMARAFRQNDLDLFMTVIADDFRDEEGNGKRALRVALQAFKETGEFATVAMDWSRMRVSDHNGKLDTRPIYIITPSDRFTIHLGFQAYEGKLLIATGSAT